MGALAKLLGWLESLNSALLYAGRSLAWICVAIMVVSILIQVFFRYVLNNALPWPEEVARALMMWMTAFAAPSAYRWGGFVSIDMFRDALPGVLRRVVVLALLVIALAVLAQLVDLSFSFYERGFRTRMATIDLPRAYIYLSLPVCFVLMILVSVELVLREICRILGGDERFPDPRQPFETVAE